MNEGRNRKIEKNRTATVESEYKVTPREYESKIVIENRKPSIFRSFLLILIGALIATIVLLLIYIFKIDKKEDSNVQNPQVNVGEEQEKSVVKLDLAIEGDFVQGLYKKIPMQVRGYEPYYARKTTEDKISENNKLLFILRKMQDENIFESVGDVSAKLHNKIELDSGSLDDIKKFDFNKLEKEYKSVFGEDKNVPLIDAETDLGYVYEYNEEDNCFYGHSYAGGGGGDFTYKTNIIKVEQNENGTEVYIYDTFIAFDYDHNNYITSPNTFAMYKTSDGEVIIADLLRVANENSFNIYGDLTKEELFEKYKDQAGNFKHTYKVDETGNYYWYSSEYIK